MDVLPDEVAPEDLLDHNGLLCEILQIPNVAILSQSQLELLACVVGPEVRFYLDCRCLLPEELLPAHVHAELGLYLEGGCVVTAPLLLDLVGLEIVEFLGQRLEVTAGGYQFHLSQKINIMMVSILR